MTNRINVTIGGSTVEEPLSPQEQAEFDALQTTLAAERTAYEQAIAAIPFDPDDNAIDPAKALAYVQNTNAFLALATPTNADVLAQVKRDARFNRAVAKLLIRRLL